jgi:hypothetical protein
MALKIQASFAAGELDPALHERTTLQKYDSGLKTARNAVVGRTGRLMSRPGRKHLVQTKLEGRRVILYSPPRSNLLLEWGHLYVRVYAYNNPTYLASLSGADLVDEYSHALTEDDLDKIHFETSGQYVFVFCQGKETLKLFPDAGGGFVSSSDVFSPPPKPTAAGYITATGTGYDVEYAITVVRGGQESPAKELTTSAGVLGLPIAAGEQNPIYGEVPTIGTGEITEFRFYRRPRQGGAYGYIGSSSYLAVSAFVPANTAGHFVDTGFSADYSHNPPESDVGTVTRGSRTDPIDIDAQTGCMYQQRLLLADGEVIYASRPGYANNFTRDFPLGSDSSLAFKSGASGYAYVLRMIDSDGLVAFTRTGVFLHTGALTPTNLSLAKKGPWVIDERVPPIAVPGGVLFIDRATHSVRCLAWSTEAASYSGEDMGIWSDHLFQGIRVASWAFHAGEIPLLWVVFSDKTFASFTYEREHEMRAWTRHDSSVNVEYVCGSDVADTSYFIVEKDGVRSIEVTLPRYASADASADDADVDKTDIIAAMDSIMTFSTKLNDDLAGSDELELAPVDPHDWTGSLDLTCGTSGLFPSPGAGDVGTILRMFDEDGTNIDLEVTLRIDDNHVRVTPSNEFPSAMASNPNVYVTQDSFTGLDHLEGEDVAVIVDGYVVGSPNNDAEHYPEMQVSGGTLSLPGSLRGAIVHVGRPQVGDLETLDVDTVEQRPVLLESKTVNKVYIKVHRSRGLYVGHRFPDGDGVAGMQELCSMEVDYEDDNPIVANRYDRPQTKRIEVTLPGDWRSNGRVCIRQADPIHWEILSIVPDLEDLRR